MDNTRFDELARRLLDSLPQGLAELDHDIRRNLRVALGAALTRMDLVTREEFEVQSRVLARTREKLEILERRAQALEERVRAREQDG